MPRFPDLGAGILSLQLCDVLARDQIRDHTHTPNLTARRDCHRLAALYAIHLVTPSLDHPSLLT